VRCGFQDHPLQSHHSLFSSGANDAVFHANVTDIITINNRGIAQICSTIAGIRFASIRNAFKWWTLRTQKGLLYLLNTIVLWGIPHPYCRRLLGGFAHRAHREALNGIYRHHRLVGQLAGIFVHAPFSSVCNERHPFVRIHQRVDDYSFRMGLITFPGGITQSIWFLRHLHPDRANHGTRSLDWQPTDHPGLHSNRLDGKQAFAPTVLIFQVASIVSLFTLISISETKANL
jgi:hypothetical protein